MRSLRVLGPLVAGVALVVASCGSGATPAPSAGASAGASTAASAPAAGECPKAPADTAATATVTIADFAYGPASVTIAAGETVAWTNEDSQGHTATTTDGACDTGSISQGNTVALTFEQAGTYEYSCTIHPTMPKATVEVTG